MGAVAIFEGTAAASVSIGGEQLKQAGRNSRKARLFAKPGRAGARGGDYGGVPSRRAGIVIRGGAAKGAPAPGKRPGAMGPLGAGRPHDRSQGMAPVEFVLRFTFSHPDMDTTIVGTVNPSHLHANLAALRDGPLPPDLYAEAKRRLPPLASRRRPCRELRR